MMKSPVALKLLLAALVSLPLSALAETIEGKINGLNCALTGFVCPIDKRDPVAALEADFVLQKPDGEYYLIPNVDRAVKARYFLEEVRVTGQVDSRYKAITADTLEIKQDGAYKTVWSQQAQEELRKELFGRPFDESFNPGSQ